MIYLLLSVACSLAIGMIFKHAGRRGMERLALLTVNYATAFLLALFLLYGGGAGSDGGGIPAALVGLGVTTGALFIAGFFMLSLATDVAGMSLATAVMRVSVVIPFLASWWIWDEVPSTAQGLGLLLAGAAFFLIARRPAARRYVTASDGEGQGEKVGVLALLFVVGGLVDVCMKAFDEAFAAGYARPLFLLAAFGVAALIGLGFVLYKGIWNGLGGGWPRGETVAWGVALGLVNYGSAAFILRAIEMLSGPFVFPANSVSLVIGGALLGVFFWGERLSAPNWLGLLLAAAALVLLSP